VLRCRESRFGARDVWRILHLFWSRLPPAAAAAAESRHRKRVVVVEIDRAILLNLRPVLLTCTSSYLVPPPVSIRVLVPMPVRVAPPTRRRLNLLLLCPTLTRPNILIRHHPQRTRLRRMRTRCRHTSSSVSTLDMIVDGLFI
jgi:hypothetical protein